ncbi:hypothetical protein PA27867_1906 [Cryobacterium arcticum]|uniref:DUF3000 domain-containing protein n=1 Tax=Cryobacterium arcticum TaxID=670052 RepID=A0A1B1BJM1_9MICO|nr:hypothetical protein PA27867_1906 [Cryobacterium arcticum]
MPDSEDQPQRPAQFAAALDAIRHATPRAELIVTEISAPGNLAPYSVALSADVTPVRHGSDSDFGTGRFILLYDPDEPESWGGPFRVVCFAQAPLETDIGVDPFLAEVAWAWLVDALDARGARYTAASGTATKILSSGFGELAHQGDGAQIELRASWSPLDNDLGAHVEGWGELLCMLAGLPPTTDLPTLPRRSHPAGSNPGSSHHGSTHQPGAHEAGSHRPGTHEASTEPHDARHDEASGTGGISVGPLDSIGPSITSMRRSGSGLPTLGVTATGPDSGGMETVGVDTAGPDPLGTPGAGRETVGMNAVGMNAVDSNAVGINAVRINAVGRGTVRLKAVGLSSAGLGSDVLGSDVLDSVGLGTAGSPAGAPTMAVADLSARRAARG